jgi:hypothetical protein
MMIEIDGLWKKFGRFGAVEQDLHELVAGERVQAADFGLNAWSRC